MAQCTTDPLPARLRDDPWDRYEAFRREQPVVWSPRSRSFIVFAHADAVTVLTSPAFAASHPFRASRRLFRPTVLDTDGQVHDRLRRVLADPFRPSRVASYAADVVHPLVEGVFTGAGSFDAVPTVAAVLPFQVLGRLLGIEAGAVSWLRLGTRRLAAYIDHGGVALGKARAELDDLQAALIELVLDRPRSRFGPLGQAIVAAVDDGELSRQEAVDNLALLVIAGTETTSCAIGHVLRCVLDRPEVVAAVAEGAVPVRSVVREALRLQPSVRFTPRFVARRTTLAGVELGVGAVVQVCLPSANRDGQAFEAPDEWRPGRGDEASALSFGRGAHSCVGASLGQLEGELILRELADRRPVWRAEAPSPSYAAGWTFRRLESLRLHRVDPALP